STIGLSGPSVPKVPPPVPRERSGSPAASNALVGARLPSGSTVRIDDELLQPAATRTAPTNNEKRPARFMPTRAAIVHPLCPARTLPRSLPRDHFTPAARRARRAPRRGDQAGGEKDWSGRPPYGERGPISAVVEGPSLPEDCDRPRE